MSTSAAAPMTTVRPAWAAARPRRPGPVAIAQESDADWYAATIRDPLIQRFTKESSDLTAHAGQYEISPLPSTAMLPSRSPVSACALLLLYGQPISRIVRISTGHLAHCGVAHCGDDIYLTIKQRPLPLPAAIATLVQELSQTATPKSQLAGRGSPSALLFPASYRAST